MKLRLRNDSVRLRLSRREVAALVADGSVETSTYFAPASAIVYRVVASGEEISAVFRQGQLTIAIPRATVERWAAGDDLAISGDHVWDDGALRILVEKDLACTKPRPEDDQSDLFPNTTRDSAR